MTIGELLVSLGEVGLLTPSALAPLPPGAASADVASVTYDSRKVVPGSIFVALQGARSDGATFAAQAAARGAELVIAQTPPPAAFPVPWLMVADARLALAALAAGFYRDPSKELSVVGITGTNGKTTTAYLIAEIFEAAGVRTGLISTVTYRVGAVERDAVRTTPEAPELQEWFRAMVNQGCGACAIEVSSHALALKRVERIRFAAAIFTNLTRDHLDFHGDMESYFRAKRRLFEMLPPNAPAIVNVDDPRSATLVTMVHRPVTYAINRPADVTTGPLSGSLAGLAFDILTPRGTLRARSPLLGRPNVYNILAAVSAAVALELPSTAIERGIAELATVPGRFQIVSDSGDEITVVVDYAHTDDALRNLLETARSLAGGRLITVFGCGGDRDRTKRPLMGAVAARLSDVVVVTSDNPRNEDPRTIIEEVLRGIQAPEVRPRGDRTSVARAQPEVLAIIDRRQAIEKAIELARPGDLVLLAGKGHEKYQITDDHEVPFDERAIAREALARRRTKSGVR